MLRDNGEGMEIERPFESLSNDELWKAIRKRRTSPKQRNLQLELIYRLHHWEIEAEHWKELAKSEREARDEEQKEREHLEKLYYGG